MKQLQPNSNTGGTSAEPRRSAERRIIVQRQSPFVFAAILTVVLAAQATIALGQVPVTLLPGLTGENDGNFALTINNNRVVGGTVQPGVPGLPGTFTEPRRAAIWSGGTYSILPGLPGATPGGLQGNAVFALNDQGVAVGLGAFPATGDSYAAHAAKWVNGVPQDLGSLPDYTLFLARSINESGEMAGNGFSGFDFTNVASRWNPAGQLQELSRLPTHNSSAALSINHFGRIVGFSGFQDLDFTTEELPVAWDGTTPTEIPLPVGANQGLAQGINDAGVIVGTSAFFDVNTYETTGARPFVYAGGTTQSLPLPAGFVSGSANSVNNSGWILGRAFVDDSGIEYGFPSGFDGADVLWIGSEVINLDAFLAPSFAAGTLLSVAGMNDLGDLVGTATIPGVNHSVAFIVTVVPDFLLGDVNMDGVFDLLDVAPFVNVLVTESFQIEADINGDGVVDFLDIGPFVQLLIGN